MTFAAGGLRRWMTRRNGRLAQEDSDEYRS